jgi:uncharacterized membrane protein YvbJ
MARCNACGHENPEDADFCNKCATSIGGTVAPERSETPVEERPVVIDHWFYSVARTKKQMKRAMLFQISLGLFFIILGVAAGNLLIGVGIGAAVIISGYVWYLLISDMKTRK